jgi:hypothetical protein
VSALTEAQAALSELRKTTLGFVKAQQANPTTFRKTHSGLAESHLVAAVSELGGQADLAPMPAPVPAPPPPPPPTPVPGLAARAQNVMFAAWNPAAANHAPPDWKRAWSADLHVGGDSLTPDQYLEQTKLAASHAHDQGALRAAWGNQSQLGPGKIKMFGDQIGADYLIHQAEGHAEYFAAIADGAQIIIGNLTDPSDGDARADATARINAGTLAFIFEVYTNEGAPWPDAADSQGVPVASECPGVGWGATPYRLADYQPHTKAGIWSGMCVYLAEGMAETDWSLLA